MPEPTSIDDVLSSALAGAMPADLPPPADASPGEILAAQLRNTPLDELVAAQQAPAAPVEPEPVEGAALAGNWRLKADTIEERQVAALIKSGVSWKDASAQVFGSTPAAPAAEPIVAAPALPEVITTKEARLAEVRAEINAQVEASGDIGVTVTREFRQLQQEEADLVRELPVLQIQEANRTARAARIEQGEFNTSFAAWENYAAEQFPDSAVPGTPLFAAIEAESARLVAEKSPLLQLSNAPFLVAASVAAQTGYQKPAASPGAPAPVVPAVPAAAPQPVASPRIGAVPGSAASDAHRVTVASPTETPQATYQRILSQASDAGRGMIDALSALANGGQPVGVAAGVTRIR